MRTAVLTPYTHVPGLSARGVHIVFSFTRLPPVFLYQSDYYRSMKDRCGVLAVGFAIGLLGYLPCIRFFLK